MGIRLLVVQLGSLQDSQGRMPQSPLSPIEIPEGYPFRDALLALAE